MPGVAGILFALAQLLVSSPAPPAAPVANPADVFQFPLPTWPPHCLGFGSQWRYCDGTALRSCASGAVWLHTGVDIASGIQPIRAAGDGVIVGYMIDPTFHGGVLIRHRMTTGVVIMQVVPSPKSPMRGDHAVLACMAAFGISRRIGCAARPGHSGRGEHGQPDALSFRGFQRRYGIACVERRAAADAVLRLSGFPLQVRQPDGVHPGASGGLKVLRARERRRSRAIWSRESRHCRQSRPRREVSGGPPRAPAA